MDPILSEVYSTVLPAAPYVLAAYVGILLALFAFVFSLWRKSKRTEADIDALKVQAHRGRYRRPQARPRGS